MSFKALWQKYPLNQIIDLGVLLIQKSIILFNYNMDNYKTKFVMNIISQSDYKTNKAISESETIPCQFLEFG